MDSQQLTEYIKNRLQSGMTKEAITLQLLSQGLKKAEIDASFQLISVPPSNTTTQPPANKKNTVYILLSLIAILCLGMIFIIFSHTTKHTFLNKNESSIPTQSVAQQTTPLKQQIIPVTQTGGKSNDNLDNTSVFISKVGGYRFNYLKSWKANELNEITAALTAPGSPKAAECTQNKETSVSCDIYLYSFRYDTEPGAESHVKQIKNMFAQRAEKITGPYSATNPSPISATPITTVTFGSMTGFEAPTLIYDAKNGNTLTDNIILQGQKQMYIIEFRNETSPNNFDAGRLFILKSFIGL